MTVPSRYDVSDDTAELDGGVLKNKLKIADQKTLNDLEKEQEYIEACIAGMKKENDKMEKILKRCIKK